MTSTCGEHGMRVDEGLNHTCNCFCRIRDVVDTSIGGKCMDLDAVNAKACCSPGTRNPRH